MSYCLQSGQNEQCHTISRKTLLHKKVIIRHGFAPAEQLERNRLSLIFRSQQTISNLGANPRYTFPHWYSHHHILPSLVGASRVMNSVWLWYTFPESFRCHLLHHNLRPQNINTDNLNYVNLLSEILRHTTDYSPFSLKWV